MRNQVRPTTRREFLAVAGRSAALAAGLGRARVSADREVVLLLRNARWFADRQWQTGDIGIDSAGKLQFGPALNAARIVDVAGKIVSPGFVDILADNNSSNPAKTVPIFEKYKVADGVTTALQMHGGTADCDGYYARLGGMAHLIHYGASTFVMGIRNQKAGLLERLRSVERNLDQGALGVSHSLEYQPAPLDEMLEYARLARRYDRPFVLHLRYSSAERELDGVDEAIRLAEASGARVHIGHLHSTGGTFHMEAALERIRAANARGARITACVYPYSYWATYLSSRRFNTGWQQRYGISYGDLRVVGTGESLTARSFQRYRTSQTLVVVPEGSMPLDRTFDLAIREEFCMVGSDGGIQREPRANSHPRGAACFSTAIRRALDTGMPLEAMLERVSERPARLVAPAMGLRAKLEPGAAADLTVFDPAVIRGNATVENPNQFAAGIALVLVNGKPAYQDGRFLAHSGEAIRC